ncbi:MAG TPA: POTRA domain-containing protein [Gemmataceae bacterium]|jgi:outer membrane protein insertion porin family
MPRRLLSVGALMVLMSAGPLILPARAAEKFLVSDVIIQGSQRMSTEQIKVRLHTQAGKEFDPDALDEDVREMYKTRQFSNIQTLAEPDGPGKVKIYLVLGDLPGKVQKVTFLGAKHIKEEELRKETGIRPGTPLNPKLSEEGCQKILDKYKEQGRSFASCILVKGGQLGDTEVVYQITEGPKVKVRDIQFTGNTFVSGARLMIKLRSSTAWFHVLGGIYNSKMAETDVHELIKYFKSFGYPDVKVSLETRRSADGGEITLLFHIREGARRQPGNARRTDWPKPPAEQLDGPLELKAGEYLDENQPQTIETKEKPLARVGQIFLAGNKRISDESILVHVPLSPGQVLTHPDLKQAEKDLAELGLFVVDPATGVHPTITVLDRDGGVYKDILITVKEKKARTTGGKSE